MSKRVLMFHEVLDDLNDISGFHRESKGKYTISLSEFKNLIAKHGENATYTFDDGGKSNLLAAEILRIHGLQGVFCIPTGFIGKEGFLSDSDLRVLSETHIVLPHGHHHLMLKASFDILHTDWTEAVSIIENITQKPVNIVCLPGGTFSRIHARVFLALNIKSIYHSASSNLILNFLYSKIFDFRPRIVITPRSFLLKRLLVSLKSHIKQFIYY